MNQTKLSTSKNLMIILFIIIGYIFTYNFLDQVAANILIGTLIIIYIIKFVLSEQLWYKIDKFLHTKIINLPMNIKCLFRLNKESSYCYNEKSRNTWESQENGDIHLYTVGHFIIWMLIGYYSNIEKVTYTKVIVFSIIWELIESISNHNDLPLTASVTDIFINLSGFFIGRRIKQMV